MAVSRPMPKWDGTDSFKLFRGDVLIGSITDLDSDWPWMGGKIQLTPEANEYKYLWEFWTEHGRTTDPPFEVPEDIDDNWFIEDEQGNRARVEFPAVHSDGEVWWCEYPEEE